MRIPLFMSGNTTRAALKVMPPSYFMMLAHDVRGGATAVEVEPSYPYPITYCCPVTDGSRGHSDKMGV